MGIEENRNAVQPDRDVIVNKRQIIVPDSADLNRLLHLFIRRISIKQFPLFTMGDISRLSAICARKSALDWIMLLSHEGDESLRPVSPHARSMMQNNPTTDRIMPSSLMSIGQENERQFIKKTI
jgi:hypothetical protein